MKHGYRAAGRPVTLAWGTGQSRDLCRTGPGWLGVGSAGRADLQEDPAGRVGWDSARSFAGVGVVPSIFLVQISLALFNTFGVNQVLLIATAAV